MIEFADLDKDGFIDFSEFKTIILKEYNIWLLKKSFEIYINKQFYNFQI